MLTGTALQKKFTIGAMAPADGQDVLGVYAKGIAGGHASFAECPPSWEDWDRDHLDGCRLVARTDEGQLIGWAALAAVSSRCVYRGVAEVSIYIDPAAHGKGVGSSLLKALVEQSEKHGFWTLQAGIFPENVASLALHGKHGFERLGVYRGMGKMTYGPMAGQWRDVIMLERRSTIVGID